MIAAEAVRQGFVTYRVENGVEMYRRAHNHRIMEIYDIFVDLNPPPPVPVQHTPSATTAPQVEEIPKQSDEPAPTAEVAALEHTDQ